MKPVIIRVADEFSREPAGRYREDGPFSGEEFREDYLTPALERSGRIVVVLDGARGYPSSFLDEAFAGLARKKGWSRSEFLAHVSVEASAEYRLYKDDILSYIKDTA